MFTGVRAQLARASDGPEFTSAGKLTFPKDYRSWVFLSSGLGMTYGPLQNHSSQQSPLFDNVFVNRPAYDSFVQTGRWPDRTMFVLEVRSSRSKGSINNGGHFQGDLTGIESEVKQDGKWRFFDLNENRPAGSPIPQGASCYSCHAQNGAVDNTFVQFYPTLFRVAKEKGTLRPSFE